MSTRVTLGPVGTGGPIGPAGAAGAPGAAGATGPQGPPGVGNWKGVWSNTTAYAFQDEVQGSDGLYYFAVQANTGHNPTTDSSHTYWVPTLPASVPILSSDGRIALLSALAAINVKNYGAKGDGVTDDTTAINAALAAGRTAVCPVYFPGTSSGYKFTSSLLVHSGDRLIGDKWGFGQTADGPSYLKPVFSSPAPAIQPATPTAFTDGVVVQDLYISGDNTNVTNGIYMPSSRHWVVDRVFISNCTSHPLYLYGQRTGTGGLSPGDNTYNTFRDCVFEANNASADAAHLGGTLVNCGATVTSAVGASDTSIPVSDTSLIQGNAGTIVLDSEWINFAGKSTSSGAGNLTGCTRGVCGTTAATHTSGTGFAVRRSMGTSNMNVFTNCMFTSQGGASRRGLWVEAGASNSFVKCSFVSMGNSGVRFSWYSNDLHGCVSENNGGYGVHFDNAYDAHDNWLFRMHDGGTNTLGFVQDDSGANGWIAFNKGIRLPMGSTGLAPAPLPNSLYGATDGLPHWQDGAGNNHTLSYISRLQVLQTYRGIITETFPQFVAATALTPTTSATPNGTVYLGAVGLQAGDVVTNIIMSLIADGVGTAPNLIKLALLGPASSSSSTVTVLASTANLASDSRWTSGTGPKVCALSAPYTITADGAYFLAFLQSGPWGTTQMTLNAANTASSPTGLITGGGRGYAISAAQTDISGTVTFAAASGGAAWLACS